MPYFGNNPSPILLNTLAQNGKEMTLDADADTSITADTDDQIDIKIGGADDFQFTANTFTVKSGSTIVVDDTTDSTSTTTGSIQTDGGVGIAKDIVIGDDILLKSDAAVVKFGADSDVTLTHVADTGLLLNSTMALQFNDASQSINAPSATVLDINATDEIELNATAVDLNGTLDVSGTSNFNNNLTVSENNPELFLAATVDGGEGSVGFKDDDGNIDGKIAYRTDYSGQTDNYMTFNTAGSERMRIDDSGNVAIANTSPSSQYMTRLVVGDGSGTEGITIYSGNDATGRLEFSDATSGDGRYAGGIVYEHNNNKLRFNTNGGNERMSIDSNGIVSMPLQPAVIAHNNGNNNVSFSSADTYEIVQFNIETIDRNADYASSQTFTAPVDGTYYANANVLRTATSSGSITYDLAIYVNSSLTLYSRHHGDNSGSNTATQNVTGLLDLDASDTVQVYARVSDTKGQRYRSQTTTYFHVFLLG